MQAPANDAMDVDNIIRVSRSELLHSIVVHMLLGTYWQYMVPIAMYGMVCVLRWLCVSLSSTSMLGSRWRVHVCEVKLSLCGHCVPKSMLNA